MKFKNYDDFVGTCPSFDDPALGLPGEVGEVLELIKKDRRPGERQQPMDVEKLDLELGDILWYVTKTAHLYGRNINTIAKKNKKKLTERHDIK